MSGEDYEEDDGWGDQFDSHGPDEDGDIPHFGCLFPDECCMPGPHWTDECHTAEMLEQQFEDKETRRGRAIVMWFARIIARIYRFFLWTAERQEAPEIEDNDIPF